jgi:hypothetical protein
MLALRVYWQAESVMACQRVQSWPMDAAVSRGRAPGVRSRRTRSEGSRATGLTALSPIRLQQRTPIEQVCRPSIAASPMHES